MRASFRVSSILRCPTVRSLFQAVPSRKQWGSSRSEATRCGCVGFTERSCRATHPPGRSWIRHAEKFLCPAPRKPASSKDGRKEMKALHVPCIVSLAMSKEGVTRNPRLSVCVHGSVCRVCCDLGERPRRLVTCPELEVPFFCRPPYNCLNICIRITGTRKNTTNKSVTTTP